MMQILIELCGWIAVAMILGSYLLLSIGRMQARSALYQWMNLIGAAGFVVNCTYKQAWPSVFLNLVWGGIALFALWRNARATSS